MATTKIINAFCAVNKSSLVDVDASLSKVNGIDQKIVFGDQVQFRFTCISTVGDATAFKIPGTAALEFIVTDRVNATTADIVGYAHDAKFDNDLWSAANRTNGKVVCEVNFNTANLSTKIGDSASVDLLAALVMVPAGTDFHITLCQFALTVQATLYRIGANTPGTIDLVPSALESSSSWSVTTSSTSSESSTSSTSESCGASTTSISTTSISSTSETSHHAATRSSSSSSTSSTSESSEHSSTTNSSTSISSTSESTQSDISNESSSSSCSSTAQMSTSSTSVSSQSTSSSGVGFDTPAIDDYETALTAVWHMEESGTNDRLDSVGSNDLTPFNTLSNPAGKHNNAVEFGATDGPLQANDSVDLSPTGTMAVSFWVNFDTAAGASNRNIAQKGGVAYGVYQVALTKIRFLVKQSDDTVKDVLSSNIGAGSYKHIVCIADDGKLLIYLAGALIAEGTYDGTIKDTVGTLDVGGGALDGKIDELYFWKDINFASATARDTFASALYNSGSGRFYVP